MPKLIEYFNFRQGFSGPPVQGGRRGREHYGGESGEGTETRPPSSVTAGICVSGGLSRRGDAERQLKCHHDPVPAALPVAQPENIRHRASRFMNSMASGESRQPADGRRGEKRTHPKYMFTV